MQLFIRSQSLHCLELDGSESVLCLKQKISEIEGIALDSQVFSHGGVPMNDEDSLVTAGLGNLSTIDVVPRLLGGKVHGSLARAGKVKGQTPKVDPQEKKKSKTGRAKRRMQYNRRFVNVVATFGRRKGPNSNS